jgi:hypothetical protein
MAAAALIVAILALIVSAFSARYAWQLARIEQDRRLAERRPEISARLYESSDPGQSWVLELLLLHDTPSGPLAEVTAVISRFTDGDGNSYPAGEMYLGGGRPGARFMRGQAGVTAGQGFDPMHTARWATADGQPRPLRPGESAQWQAELHEAPGRPVRLDLEVTCRAEDSRWTLALPVDVPHDPTKTIW